MTTGPCDTPEARPYRLWILGVSLSTAIAIVVCSTLLKDAGYGSGTRLALALTPVTLFVGLIGLMVKQVRRLDELQRRIQLEALAVAFPAAGAMGLGVEYLQKAGFAEGWTIGDVWPWMFLVYVPAYLFAHRRYR